MSNEYPIYVPPAPILGPGATIEQVTIIVDSTVANYLPLIGGTITGNLTVDDNIINNSCNSNSIVQTNSSKQFIASNILPTPLTTSNNTLDDGSGNLKISGNFQCNGSRSLGYQSNQNHIIEGLISVNIPQGSSTSLVPIFTPIYPSSGSYTYNISIRIICHGASTSAEYSGWNTVGIYTQPSSISGFIGSASSFSYSATGLISAISWVLGSALNLQVAQNSGEAYTTYVYYSILSAN